MSTGVDSLPATPPHATLAPGREEHGRTILASVSGSILGFRVEGSWEGLRHPAPFGQRKQSMKDRLLSGDVCECLADI